MLAGISNEYTSLSFPRILAPNVAQVQYLVQQLRVYEQTDPARQSALQELCLRCMLASRGAPDFADLGNP